MNVPSPTFRSALVSQVWSIQRTAMDLLVSGKWTRNLDVEKRELVRAHAVTGGA